MTKPAYCTASAAECMSCVSLRQAAHDRCCAGQHAARASWSQLARTRWVVEQGSTAYRGGQAWDQALPVDWVNTVGLTHPLSWC